MRFHMLPRASTCFHALPSASKCSQVLPRASMRFQVLPRASTWFHALPRGSMRFHVLRHASVTLGPASLVWLVKQWKRPWFWLAELKVSKYSLLFEAALLRFCFLHICIFVIFVIYAQQLFVIIIIILGGNPYDGWSECDIMVELKTNEYRMPKPEHVSDRL